MGIGEMISMPNWEESDLADRMLVDPPYKEAKFVLDLKPSGMDRKVFMDKVREMTNGRFFYGGRWVQFEDEQDYFVMRLAVK